MHEAHRPGHVLGVCCWIAGVHVTGRYLGYWACMRLGRDGKA